MALVAAVQVRRRALLLAALLSVALGAALSHDLPGGGGSSVRAPATSPPLSAAGLWSLPAAARASISRALGADMGAYRISAEAYGGFHARNPAQDLSARFERAGVTLTTQAVKLGLSLRAAGYGSSLRALGAAAPRLSATNVITYSRDGISESYSNGPLGLEQGFSLARAPAASSASGPLTLALAISGSAHAALARGGDSIMFGDARAGRDALRYGGLSASDASGRELHSWMTLAGGDLLLHVDSRGARFPLNIDPLIEQEPEQKLAPAASEAGIGGKFGFSVALSGDGSTALVGAPGEGEGVGAAWVFTRSTEGWVQQGPKLTIPSAEIEAGACRGAGGEEVGEEPGEEPGEETSEEANQCRFGQALSLSADGEVAIIGAPREDSNVGDAWVFTRSGSSWSPGLRLTSPEAGMKRRFGASVAVSGDGSTIIVGAPRLRGRLWTYARSGQTWAQQGSGLSGAGEQGEGFFGRSVALSENGQTALVGAPADSANQGAAWAYTRAGAAWLQHGEKLTGTGESAEAHFGFSVALAGDGDTALIGARANDAGNGAAWAFVDSASGWSPQGPALVGGAQAGEEFGYSVALSADGNTGLVGAPSAGGGLGQVLLFERSAGVWGEAQATLTGGAQESSKALFGSSVSLSFNGEAMLVGGRFNDKPGAAWVFGKNPSVVALTPDKGAADGGTTVTISGENFTGATAVRFGAAAAESFAVSSQKSITAVSPPGTGTVDVTVETPVGVSAIGPADRFKYSMRTGQGGGEGSGGNGEGGELSGKGAGGPPGGTANSQGAASGAPAANSETVVLDFHAASPACGVSLRSNKVSVRSHGRALLALLGTGTGACSGKLRLNVRLKLARKRYRTKTIGTAVFAVSAGKTVTVAFKLNAAGRALLKADHGRLNASLLIVKSLPAPAQARSASVRLTQQRVPRPKPSGK
jgi:hypothetical protein